mgnify:CR=1 FL=1
MTWHEFVQLDTRNGKYRIVNIYYRDGKLTYTQLSTLENFGSRTFCMGDLMPREFQTYTQAKNSNRNGDTFLWYLYWDDAAEQESNLHFHNINVHTKAATLTFLNIRKDTFIMTKGLQNIWKKNNPQIIDRKLYFGHKRPIPNIQPLNLKNRMNLVDIHNTIYIE